MISTSEFKELNAENIFIKITGFDIFKYYVTNFKKMDVSFCSELREDKNPGVRIRQNKGNWLYKDFSFEEHTFSPIGYVMAKYVISYGDALKKINSDFNLNLGAAPMYKTKESPIIHNREDIEKLKFSETEIRIVSMPYKNKHLVYYAEQGIYKPVLDYYKVKALEGYFLKKDGSKKYIKINKNNKAFAYCYGNYKYKILQPDNNFKWITNANKEIVQGWSQLPETGDLCIITSSLKDAMLFYTYGYAACAPGSEMGFIPESKLKELKERFKEVIIFFDNDSPGITSAAKYASKYDIHFTHIPEEYPEKDITDFYKKYKKERTKILIDSVL